IRLTVANKGKVDGTEIVQVYLHRVGDEEGPIKTLRGFKRVEIPAWKKVTTLINLPRESFECCDTQSNSMRVLPGEYDVYVGTSSRTEDCQVIRVVI
ncbi:MAG: fibronectin type III-like domain-contianing protein, partial [Bacteroidaceae bacterium]|nr:fibronectin type III-like domain-contianing protein [Bacteroidaceae bacterium]